MRRAIYPGSFDPVTNGHMDIIERASKIFDEVVVAVAVNISKSPMFLIEDRLFMLQEASKNLPNVRVDSFDGLLVRYAEEQGASAIVKGLRALSDFEFEFEMALMNRRLDTDIETVFMMTSVEYSYLSSSMIKEVSSFGGSVEGLVPEIVLDYLSQKASSTRRIMQKRRQKKE
ncbi:MAG: pantetheine-phosphate adenylyltransferase [Armatimonadota bacterium]|jgi:pantetheine-phosphate adenylyltransferase|nr:pantetheine-phosphate adenylyltransferase [Armatimonadota bacterium]